jgi:hypothetical protein
MIRERAQKVVLVIVGLLFVTTVCPLLFLLRNDETLQMMLSLYVITPIVHNVTTLSSTTSATIRCQPAGAS